MFIITIVMVINVSFIYCYYLFVWFKNSIFFLDSEIHNNFYNLILSIVNNNIMFW